MDILDKCRIVVVLIWATLLIIRGQSLYILLFKPKSAKQYDVLWALNALTAIMVIGFNSRTYIDHDSTFLYVFLYMFCATVGLFKIGVSFRYSKAQKDADNEITASEGQVT